MDEIIQKKRQYIYFCLVDLCQQCSCTGMVSLLELMPYIPVNNFAVMLGHIPVLSSEDQVSCLRKQHHPVNGIQTCYILVLALRL